MKACDGAQQPQLREEVLEYCLQALVVHLQGRQKKELVNRLLTLVYMSERGKYPHMMRGHVYDVAHLAS